MDETNATGVTTVNVNSSTGAVTVSNLGAIVATNLTSTTGAVIEGYKTAVVAGTADSATLTLNAVDSAFTANGLETVNVATTGAASGATTRVVIDGGDVKTYAITGDKNLTTTLAFDTVNATGADATHIATISAGSFTGNLNANTTGITGSYVSVTAGTGNDTIYLAGDLTNKSTVAGGDGTDTLYLNGAALASTAFTNVTGIENVGFTALGAGLDLTGTGVTSVTLAGGSTGTVTGVASGLTVAYTATATTFGATVTNAGSSTTDVLNVTVGTSTGTTMINAGILTANSVETINLTSTSKLGTIESGDDAEDHSAGDDHTISLTDTAIKTLTIAGNESVTVAAGGGTSLTTVTITNAAGADIRGVTLGAAATVTSSDGADYITLVSGKNSVTAGAGDDIIIGGTGNDYINVGEGDNTVTLGNGAKNTVIGGTGVDTVTLGTGADNVDVGAGKNVVIFAEDNLTSSDTITGGAAVDTLKILTAGTALGDADFTNVTSFETISTTAAVGLTATSLGAKATATGINAFTYNTGVDNVSLAATFTGSAVAVALGSVAGGADTFDASLSAAVVTLSGSGAAFNADVLKGGTGLTDQIKITADDTNSSAFTNVTGFETITAVASTDKDIYITGLAVATGKTVLVDGSALTNDLAHIDVAGSGAGTFTVKGGAGADVLNLGSATGNNTIEAGSGANAITGGSGNDTVTTTGGNSTITMTAGGDDTVTAGAGDDSIYGGVGNDNFTGGAGNDVITGGAGNDTVSGGDGNDNITAGAGVDSLLGGAGKDTINGGAGADYLNGGDGNDLFIYGSATDSQAVDNGTATAFSGDTIDGFDFAADAVSLPYSTTGMQVGTVTIGSAALTTFATDLASSANLNAFMRASKGDAVLVTVSGGTAAGTYIVANTDGSAGYSSSDLVIKLDNATNASSFGTANFGAVIPVMTGTTTTTTNLTLAGNNFGDVAVNLSAVAASAATDAGSAVTLTQTAAYAANAIQTVSAAGLISGTNVTVSIQQSDAADHTAAPWYTSAGGTDTLALIDAGDYSSLVVTNFDRVTTTTANGGVTMTAANLTGKTLAFVTDDAGDDITITATQAAAATTTLAGLSISGGGALEMTASTTGNYSGIVLGSVSKITTGAFDSALTFASTDVTGKTIAFVGDNAGDDINVTVAQAAAATTNLSGLSISGGGAISAVLAGNGNYAGMTLGTGVTDVNIVAAGGTVVVNSGDITGKTLTVTGDAGADIMKVTLLQANAALFNSGLTSAGGATLELSVGTGDYSTLDAADIDYTVVRTDQADGATTFAALDFDGKTVAFTTDNVADVVSLTVGAADGAKNYSGLSETGAGSAQFVLTGAGTYTEELEITGTDFAGINTVNASAVNGVALFASTAVTAATVAFVTDSASDQVQVSLAQADAAAVNLSGLSELGAGSLELNVVSGDYTALDAADVVFSVVNTNGANAALTFSADDFTTKTVSFVTDNADDVVNLTVNAAGGAALTLAGLSETGAGSINYLLGTGDYSVEMLAEAFTNVHTVSTSANGAMTFAGTALTGKTVAFTTDNAADVITVTANTTSGSNDYSAITETGAGSLVLNFATATNYGTMVGFTNFASATVANVAMQVNLGSAGSAVSVTGPANSSFTVSGSATDVFTMSNATNGGDVFNGLTTGDQIVFDTAASGIIKDAGGSWDGAASANAGAVAVEGDWYFDNAGDTLTYFNAVGNAAESIMLIGVTALSTTAGAFTVAA